MKSMLNILNQRKAETPLLRRATAALIIEEANNILEEMFGKEIRRFAEAVFVKNDILSVKCQSPAAAQEIKLNEQEIIAKISKKINGKMISRIRYTT